MTNIKKILYSICVVIVIWAVWNVNNMNHSKTDTEEMYESLADSVITSEKNSETADDVQQGQRREIVNGWLDEMKSENSDLIGWLKFEDDIINYPVMQTEKDDDFYLNHDFQKNPSRHGTPFLDVNCDVDNNDNLIIYGHNMADGTMFHNLMYYKNAEYCKNHKEISFFTIYESMKFEIINVMLISDEEYEKFRYYQNYRFEEENKFREFMEECNSYSLWNNETETGFGNQLMILSTCDNSKANGRLVVIGKRQTEDLSE